ncbi:MAG: hypothetical protein LQ346_007007, partial [Caloplaca aetnensis]
HAARATSAICSATPVPVRELAAGNPAGQAVGAACLLCTATDTQLTLPFRTSALQPVFSDPTLLTSLALQHPSLTPSPLPPHLSQTQHLAQHLQSQHAALLHLRHQTQTRLLHLHALERQWRQKQSEVDARLEPWSAKNLYQRLVAREREGDDWCRGLEESFLDEGGEKVGEREVGEFVKRYREGRRGVGRRREERARWDEGRVGGWR